MGCLDKQRKEIRIRAKKAFGNCTQVDHCLTEINETLRCILLGSLENDLLEAKIQFTIFFLNHLHVEAIFVEAYKAKFKNDGVQACLKLVLKSSVQIIYHHSTSAKEVAKSLNEMIMSRVISVDYNNLVDKMVEWQSLIDKLFIDGVYCKQEPHFSKLEILCLKNINKTE